MSVQSLSSLNDKTLDCLQDDLNVIRDKMHQRINQYIELERLVSIMDKIISCYAGQEEDILQQIQQLHGQNNKKRIEKIRKN